MMNARAGKITGIIQTEENRIFRENSVPVSLFHHKFHMHGPTFSTSQFLEPKLNYPFVT
jgi:hypothetical protein